MKCFCIMTMNSNFVESTVATFNTPPRRPSPSGCDPPPLPPPANWGTPEQGGKLHCTTATRTGWAGPCHWCPSQVATKKHCRYQICTVCSLKRKKNQGFFVEAGAFDGISISNTLFFEKKRKVKVKVHSLWKYNELRTLFFITVVRTAGGGISKHLQDTWGKVSASRCRNFRWCIFYLIMHV